MDSLVFHKQRPVPHLWIIRGAPGVGKSTVGSLVGSALPGSVVLEVDVLRAMQSHIDWENQNAYHLALRQSAQLVHSFRRNQFHPVLLVDTLMPENLDYLLERLEEKFWIFTLIARSDTLLGRVSKRQVGYSKVEAIVEMNRQLASDSRGHGVIIDTSDKSADDTARLLLSIGSRVNHATIEREIFLRPPWID